MDTKNVVLFGERGVGKSSIINLLAGRRIANISPDTDVCTLHYKAYDVTIENVLYHIYDTAAADCNYVDPVGSLNAITNAGKLMNELREKGGAALLLYCIKAGRTPTMFATNYRLFYEFLFEEKVPVAVVVTNLEREVCMDDWYTRNKVWFERHAIKCVGHACITAADDLDLEYRGKYDISRAHLIGCHAHGAGDGGDAWLARLTGGLKDLLTGRPNKSDALGVLTKRCGMQESLAKDVIQNLTPKSTTRATRPQTAESTTQVISPTMAARTERNTTPSMSGPQPQLVKYHTPPKRLVVSRRSVFPNVNKREQNTIATIQSNYRLFYEFFCEKKSPVVLAITSLEKEQRMEDWWERNKRTFNKYQIQVADHACITTTNRLSDRHRHLYEESRVTIRELARKFTTDEQKQRRIERDNLFVSLMRKPKELITGSSHVKRNDLVPLLMERCGITQDVARQLANMINQDVVDL